MKCLPAPLAQWLEHLTRALQNTGGALSYNSEMLWGEGEGGGGGGGGRVGALNNLQYVLGSVDGYRPGKV